jgi:hypothetical protein
MAPIWLAYVVGVAGLFAAARDETEIKFADCPPAVKKTFDFETQGARIATVMREKSDDETIYWADVPLGGRTYAVGVLEDGTLTEMNLAADEPEIPFEKCPPAVQATFRREAFGQKIDDVGVDVKYGETVYEAVASNHGKSYEIVVSRDGTLVEKVLVVEDEEIELEKCPQAVREGLTQFARGGVIHDVVRSTGIGSPTYEAEVEIDGKVYLIEVSDRGRLISKSLDSEAQ